MPGPRHNSHHFAFVVDTNEYAGSFERQLTAFCTGQIGECGVGREYAEVFLRDCAHMRQAMERLVVPLPDDHGCHRPTSIWSTPGYWSDGMGRHWEDSALGTPEAILAYRDSVRQAQKERRAFLTVDADKAFPERHPAYQSVAMFLAHEPEDNILRFLISRVEAYKPIGEFEATFKAIGYRMVKTETVDRVLWQRQP